MGHIGNKRCLFFKSFFHPDGFSFFTGNSLFKTFPLSDEFLTFIVFQFGLHGFGIFISLPAELISFGDKGVPLVVEAYHLIHIGAHVSGGDIGLNGLGVFFNVFQIKHSGAILYFQGTAGKDLCVCIFSLGIFYEDSAMITIIETEESYESHFCRYIESFIAHIYILH